MINDNHTAPRLLLDDGVNFCYLDESGLGREPVATMVGIVVDSGRMRLTKQDWDSLLKILRDITHRNIVELKTSDFYAGNGVWRGLDGSERAKVIDAVCDWLIKRKHQIVYSSVLKKFYYDSKKSIPVEVNTIWRFMAFHITLAIQRFSQPEKIPKGNTLLIFDNKEDEEEKFINLVKNPPPWSEEYYNKESKSSPLDQIIDIPHFADSKNIGLLQVADFIAFFLRRYAEVREGLSKPRYIDEAGLLNGWIKKLCECRIQISHIYRKIGRNNAQELFCCYASPSIRDL